jgi:hypothetical protein
MDLRLQLLDSFMAQGSDGATYKVRAYERLAPDLSLGEGSDRWESTGVAEYRLDDGRVLDARPDGSWQVPAAGLVLRPLR